MKNIDWDYISNEVDAILQLFITAQKNKEDG